MRKILYIFILFMAANVHAQILYTNPEPDLSLGGLTGPGTYYHNLQIDVDIDGVNDVEFSNTINGTYNSLYVYPLADSLEYVINTVNSRPDTLNLGNLIDSSLTYSSSQPLIGGSFAGMSYGSGLFDKTHNLRFLGIRMFKNNHYYYGWVQLSYWTNVVYDYAIDTTGNFIKTGEGIPPLAKNILASDIANHKNSSDIKVSFTKPDNNAYINKYKLFVVPQTTASTFNQTYADGLDSTKYVLINNNSNMQYTDTLSTWLLDTQGDTIKEYVNYYCYVMSLCDSNLNNQHLLSSPGNLFYLSSTCPTVTNLSVTATYNADLHYNLNLKFDTILSQSGIAEYRVFFFPDNVTFSANSSDSLFQSNAPYVKILPQQLNYNINLYTDTLLLSNHQNLERKKIHYLVMSVPDTNMTTYNRTSVSAFSGWVTLKTYSPKLNIKEINDMGYTNGVTQKVGIDIPQGLYPVTVKTYFKSFINGWQVNEDSLFNNQYQQSIISDITADTFLHVSAYAENDITGQTLQKYTPYMCFIEDVFDTLHSDISTASYYNLPFEFADYNHFSMADSTSLNTSFVNFNPDSIIPLIVKAQNYRDFDFNHDNIPDLRVLVSHASSPSYTEEYNLVSGLNGTQVVENTYNNHLVADTLMSHVQLNQFMNWQSSGYMSYYFTQMVYTNISYGVWCNSKYHYLGIRIPVAGGYLYGWVRLNCEIRVDAYAITTSLVGIEQYKNLNNGISIYPNPACTVIQLAVSNEQLVETKVFDVLGKEVLQSKQSSIDVSTLANGVYFVQVKTIKGISTQKIIVQH